MNEIRLCTFRVGATVCAVDVTRVREILRATEVAPVPGASYAGLLARRGEPMAVIDLRQSLKQPPTGPGQLVVVEVARSFLGLLVDRTLGVIRAPLGALRPLPAMGGPVPFAGSLAHESGVVLLLDVKAMLKADPQLSGPAVPPARPSRRRGKAA